MPHPDSKILADILIHPLTPEQRVCIVRVCNLLNDLHVRGTGTATEDAERNRRLDAALTRIRTEDLSRFDCTLVAAEAQGLIK